MYGYALAIIKEPRHTGAQRRGVGVQFRAEWSDTMTWVAPSQSPSPWLSFSLSAVSPVQTPLLILIFY